MKIIHYADESLDSSMVGNKALRLAELTQAGFRVPAFFVIDPKAYRQSLDAENQTLADGSFVGCSVLLLQKITTAFRQQFAADALVAVRSSSADEDGVENSFAGQFDSFLNVMQADVGEHVARVWKSASSDHLNTYRRSQGIVGEVSVPAVMVQSMVPAETAGVAFAADPVSGCLEHAVVAAGHGLGDALVSGEEQGDTWRVDKRGSVKSSEVQDEADPVLSKRQIRQVAALVRKVSKFYGRPQDIEWAISNSRIYLLQSRDITTLQNQPNENRQSRDITTPQNQPSTDSYALWDNSNIVESYGGVTTPLTFSVARSAYADAYRYLGRVIGVSERSIQANEKTYEQMIGLIDGRVYYNLLNWYRLLMLTPGFRFNRRFMEQMMGVTQSLPDSAVPETQGDSRFAGLRATLGLLRVSWRLTTRLLFHNRRVRLFHKKIELALPRVDFNAKTLEQLVSEYETLQTTVIPAWDVPLINDLYCMIFHGALRKLCERWLPENLAEIHNNLVSGEAGIISLEPVRRLQAMADFARGDDSFVALLKSGSINTIRKAIVSRKLFRHEFDDYLDKFGDRCLDELKLESLTIADDPLPMLRGIGQMATMGAAKTHTSSLRPDAEEDVFEALAASPVRRFLFKKILGQARARVRDRENLRFERTRVYGRVRAIFVAIGKQLQALNIIDSADDIFYLEVDEVIRFVQGTSSSIALAGTIAARREEFSAYQAMPNPPRRFLTCGPAQLASSREEIETEDADNDEFFRQGQACSQGIVRGQVRIVRDPRSANVQAGEILVAERTDPGWVTIFPLVTGMIMERGSLLSHSAIVARELGLPCVVGVEDACNWLKDGDWVEINGATGTIRRIAAEEKAA